MLVLHTHFPTEFGSTINALHFIQNRQESWVLRNWVGDQESKVTSNTLSTFSCTQHKIRELMFVYVWSPFVHTVRLSNALTTLHKLHTTKLKTTLSNGKKCFISLYIHTRCCVCEFYLCHVSIIFIHFYIKNACFLLILFILFNHLTLRNC